MCAIELSEAQALQAPPAGQVNGSADQVYYLLTDHASASLSTSLGSTSVVTDGSGNNPFYLGYDAWGATRYTHGMIPDG